MALNSVVAPIQGLTWIKGDPRVVPPPGPCILEFWATWCGPCLQTIPHLTELARRHAGQLTVVGISMDEDATRLRRFVDSMGSKMDYLVVGDFSGQAQKELFMKSGARGVPHAFVLDAQHRIVYSGHPADPSMAQKLQSALASGGGAAAPQQQQETKREVLPVTESFEELMGHSVKELKAMLTERGVSHADCLEKSDLARRIVERCSQVTHYI